MDIKSFIVNNEPMNAADLLELMEPSINLSTKKEPKGVVGSKFFGIPDVGEDFIHPTNNKGKNLTFFCQIIKNDLMPYSEIDPHLQNGMLYFFIDTSITEMRYPQRHDEFKIIYSSIENINSLKPYNYTREQAIFDEYFIRFNEEFSFPSFQEYEITSLGEKSFELSEIIYDIEDMIRSNRPGDPCIGHQIFGHPEAIQGTVKFHWAMQNLGYEFPLSEQQHLEVNNLEMDFILLLQMDFSDPNLKSFQLYGDSIGYFGIRKEDLRKLNFQNINLCLQNT